MNKDTNQLSPILSSFSQLSTKYSLQLESHVQFMFEKVFVINLTHRQDRWRFIVDQLRRHAQFPPHLVERVAAVDGRTVSLDQLHRAGLFSPLGWRRLQERQEHLVWGMDLTPGAVGCALSHILIWQRILTLTACRRPPGALCAPTLPYLVVEDDSLFPADFTARYEAVLPHVPAGWELLYLSGLDTAGQCDRLRVAEGVCRVPGFHRTTNAYAVTPAGARELLRCCLPLTYQLDTMMTLSVAQRELAEPYVVSPNCYTLRPPLVVQTTTLGSDIQSPTGGDPSAEEEQRRRDAGW
ncbi:glycosyl transferase-like protein [Angomonas deanei]|nr:glycosyl transferase-like protein [Angomonas deanei]|eukprot:EPY29799.1 glycosyl transferase-like protein [Angomonas deanei]